MRGYWESAADALTDRTSLEPAEIERITRETDEQLSERGGNLEPQVPARWMQTEVRWFVAGVAAILAVPFGVGVLVGRRS